MRFGGEESQFRPCAADIAAHVGRVGKNRLNAAEHRIGLHQRCPHRHLVIQNEGPFIHFRHETVVDVLIEPPGRQADQQRRYDTCAWEAEPPRSIPS